MEKFKSDFVPSKYSYIIVSKPGNRGESTFFKRILDLVPNKICRIIRATMQQTRSQVYKSGSHINIWIYLKLKVNMSQIMILLV